MADRLRWGILATGGIARQFAGGLRVSKTGELAATGSRCLGKAQSFAQEFGGKGYGSYEDVLADPSIDAVYIATPHHLHAEWTVKAAEAGKGVLCEKPFTLDAAEAESAIAAVRAHNVFFMEAFMYRCHPQTQRVLQLVREGEIGTIRMVNAEFGFQASRDWQNFRTVGNLGGGGLMDVGVYPISFSRLIAGENPSSVHYATHLGDGYDAYGCGSMSFPSGMTAIFGTGIHLNLVNDARIYGDEGHIVIESAWKCYQGSRVFIRRNGKEEEVWDMGCSNDQLYAYEADAVAEFFERKECPYMTPQDTLGNMETLDALRKTAGMEFNSEGRS